MKFDVSIEADSLKDNHHWDIGNGKRHSVVPITKK